MNYSTIRDNHTNGTVGEFLKENITPEADVSIVSAYFTIYAYHLLRDQLQSIDGLRFLFGEPTFIKTLDPDKGNSRSYQIEDSSLAVSMEKRLTQRAVARACREWLEGKALRQYFMANGRVDTIIDFGDSPIFENATTYTNILLWRKTEIAETPVTAFDLSRLYSTDQDLVAMLAAKGPGEALFSADGFVIAAADQATIKRRIEAAGKPLKDWGVNINYGIKTGLNEAFIIDQAKYDELVAADPRSAEVLKPILRGRDIKRYKAEWAGKYLVATFPALHIDIDTYPAVRDYLRSFGKALEQSGERGCRKKTNNKWFETQDTIAYWEEFDKEKVIWLEMAHEPSFVLTHQEIYCLDTARVMTGKDTHFIMALLNSKLTSWAFSKFYAGGNLQGNTTRYKSTFLECIPIPVLSPADQKPYEILVDCIQHARANGLDAEADTLEAVVDVMVYGLYFPQDMRDAACYINDWMVQKLTQDFPAEDQRARDAYVKKLVDFCGQDAAVSGALENSGNVAVVRTIQGRKQG